MNPWGPLLDPKLVERCHVYAQGLSLGEEREEVLPERKGIVRRVVVTHGEESTIRTEIRSLMTERLLVDAKPLGAVLVVLEISKRRTYPRRLFALTGDRAGEYAGGAIEAAWGSVMLEGSGQAIFGLRFPGEPRRLRIADVIALAETVL